MTHVNSVSTPGLLVGMLLISVIATAVVAPFWNFWTVSRALVWPTNTDPVGGFYELKFEDSMLTFRRRLIQTCHMASATLCG